MKRKRPAQGLFTVPDFAKSQDDDVAINAQQHLNALRQGSGRSLLSWSAQGTIAFAPPIADILSTSNLPGDIHGVAPRLFVTLPSLDVRSRKSILLEPVAQPVAPENVPIDHILFNEVGQYLAVVDQLGTLTIWEQDVIATQLIPRQAFPAEMGSEGVPNGSPNRIVSLRWLHSDTKVHVAVKLTKAGDQWNCQSNSQRGSGPCNVVGKEALIAITADGRIKLCYQTPKGWKMETLRLDGGDGQTYGGEEGIDGEQVTHAAWTQDFFNGAPSKEHNLIGLALLRRDPTCGQIVSYYRVTVDFRQDQESPVRLSAVVLVNRDPLDFPGDVTHFFVLPTSHNLTSALATITLRTDEYGEQKSSLALWDITKSTTALHATFSQLSIVSNIPAPTDEAYSISLKQRCELPGVVISADIRIYASWITLGYLDGTVEVRKRGSIDKAEEPTENSKNIMTPFDGGLSFPKPKDGNHGYIATTFSPNLLAYASLHASGQVKVHPMQVNSGSALLIPVLAQKITNAFKKNGTFDDIYLVIEQYITDDFAMKLLLQTMKFTGHQLEVSKTLPVEQVVSQHSWSKLVSLQYNLYSRLEKGAPIAGNGILLLQLRSMFMAFMMSCKVDPNPGPRSTIPKPQVMGRVWISPKPIIKDAMFKEFAIVSMLGYIQWLMDYLVFIVRELLLVAKDLRQKHYDREADVPSMASMIFTTVVRTFLRAGIRASTDLVKFAKQYVEEGTDVEPVHVHALTMLETTVNQSPISLDFAGKFLEEIDLIMEKILSGIIPGSDINEEIPNRTELENKLFLESVIPRPFRKAIYTVTERLIGPQSPLDIPAVIFWDTKWLGLSTLRPPGAQHLDPAPNVALWDTLRKQKLSPGRVRKCNRCGIVSAVDDPPAVNDLVRRTAGTGPGQLRNWTVLLVKNCLCFGSWSLTDLEM